MSSATGTILALGTIFLVGLAADLIGRRTGIPRVTLLLLFGIAVGSYGIDWLPRISDLTLRTVSVVTLSFVAFLLGEHFRTDVMRQVGRDVLVLSLALAVVTSSAVWLAVLLVTGSHELALMFAAVSIATDPIAIRDVLATTPGDSGLLKRINGVVVIDDAWAVIALSLVLSFTAASDSAYAATVAHELGGSLLLGVVLGVPMAMLTGRVEPGEPTLVEAAGFVLLCAGMAEYFAVSMLFAAMVMGAVTTNLARHHKRPFNAIAGIEWPLMVAFFVLTGAALQVAGIASVIVLTGVYCVARTIGRVAGGWCGGVLLKRPPSQRNWFGLALLPQAGVALGVALVGDQQLPAVGAVLLPVMVSATVLFELLGPIATKLAIIKNRAPLDRGQSEIPDSDAK